METDEDILDKVSMSEEESDKLDHCFSSYGLPSFMDIDAYMTAAIPIEEALYKLSKFEGHYNVECIIEESKGRKEPSFYLVNKIYPKERHWIVYDKPYYDYPFPSSFQSRIDYPSRFAAITIHEALYKLSHFGFYIVASVMEEFKGHKVKSFYLFNSLYNIERYWIVYKKSDI